MDEILSKLLESEALAEVLTEDARKEIQDAFKAQVNEAVATAKKETEEQVRVELTEKWLAERDALIEAVDSKIGDLLKAEITELKSDIDRFRDLEVEYAEKLSEAKAAMAKELEGDMAELLEKLDSFLEVRLNVEMQELQEDIEEVKKLEFGRKLFEAFEAEYKAAHHDEDGVASELAEAHEQLKDTTTALEESERKLAKLERQVKLDEVLSTLTGHNREVMETLLANVPTDQLDEAYNAFIGRILKEDSAEEKTSEKEDSVLAEGADAADVDGKVVTGNTEVVTEGETTAATNVKLSKEAAAKWKKLAGIIN